MRRMQIAVSGRLASIADILARQEESPLPDENAVRRCLVLLRDVAEEMTVELGCRHEDVDLERCPKCGRRQGEPHESRCTETKDTEQLCAGERVEAGCVRVADGHGGMRWERVR